MEIPERNLLIERYLPKIRGIARQLSYRLPSSFEVEDLVQIAVVALIEASERYKEDTGSSWWSFVRDRCYGSMINFVDGEIRRVKGGETNGFSSLTNPPLPSEAPDRSPNPECQAITHEQARLLIRRIGRLPKKHRAYLRLKVDGRTHSEIARRLGVSLPRISQIKTKVREELVA